MPSPIKELETLFWDFDGVILNSMHVRDLGFREIFREFPNDKVDELIAYHRLNGGLSRYVKIPYFFDEIVHVPYTEEDVQRLANEFSEIMRRELTNKSNLILDAVDYLKANHEHYNFHVVSGSDQDELRFLCKELEVAEFFISIHGSPTPKKQLVADLIAEHQYNKAKSGLIGDSINDAEAAEVNQIQFFGYNNESVRELGFYIDSLALQ